MPAKSLVFKILAAGVAAAAIITPATAASAAPPAALSPWTVAAAVIPGGTSLPAGTYAFIRSPDSHIYMRNILPGSAWIDTAIEASALTGPAVVTTPPIPAAAASKKGAKLFVHPRTKLAAKADGTAAAAAPLLDVSVLATNAAGNAVTTLNDNDDLNAWEPWYNLGGVYTTGLGASYDKRYSTPTNQVLYFAGRGTDGILYLNGTNFHSVITSPPVLSYSGAYGGTVLTYRGSDGYLYRYLNGVNGDPYSFSAPAKLSNAKVASASTMAERSLRYYYRGADNGLYFINGAAWGNAPVKTTTGAITGTPFALDEGVAGQPDRQNLFARGTDGHLYMYNTASKAWTGLGGTVA
jgi:hypothetical protein